MIQLILIEQWSYSTTGEGKRICHSYFDEILDIYNIVFTYTWAKR